MVEATQTAIVTGGGQGIGKAVAARLLQEGWNVAVAESDPDACREVDEAFAETGRLLAIGCDVSDEESVKAAIAHTVERFGRLDLLVNNAAILRNGPMEDLSLADWNAVIGTNLTGPFLCSKHAAPHLKSSQGSIINLGSTRALMSEADTEAYSASKGGVVALTHALAISLGPAVRVNCISPGWVEVSGWKKKALRHAPTLSEADHSQHPVGRVGKPEDIAALALFLASEAAGFITGQNWVVDGGMTRKMIYVD